jgi:hypothetical protein
MLIGGAIKGANKLMEIGFADVLTKMEAEVLSTPLRDMTSNLIKGEPVFKRVSFYKLGNGVVDLGIGKKVFNVNKLEEHLMGWGMYGAAGMFDLGDTPEFRVFNLSFNYDNNKESLTGMFGHWWNKMDSIDKIAFGGMVATFGGIVSTIGVNIQF